jgi:general secretion pathway protein D
MIKIKMTMKKFPGRKQETAMWLRCGTLMVLLCAVQAVAAVESAQPMQPVQAQGLNTAGASGINEVIEPGKKPFSQDAAIPKKTKSENKDMASNTGTLNFVDADIESVIAAVGDYTNTTFIIDPRVKGTLTLVSEKPLTKTQAFQLLSSVLRLRGYTVVTGNGYSKVVPEADAKLQATPIQSGAIHGDQIATQVFHLHYETAANLLAVLRPLISPNNTITADPGNNTLVITDYADNLLRLAKIISTMDRAVGNDMDVMPIRYAVASDIAAIVNRLLAPGGTATGGTALGTAAPSSTAAALAPGDPGSVTVLAYPRTNSVLIRASSEARANLARVLIQKLDQPTAVPGNVHVVYLRNAEAIELAQTLRAVVTSDSTALLPIPSPRFSTPNSSSFGSTSAPPTATPTATPTAMPTAGQSPLTTGPGANPLLSQSGGSGPGAPSGGFIQADPSTNTLIITADESVYRDLRIVIDQLDARRAQVYIEAMIVEVDANNSAELGAQWAGLVKSANGAEVGAVTAFTPQGGGNNLLTQAGAKAANTLVPPGNGLTLGILNQSGLGTLVHLLATDTKANILSMPNILTLDNEEAKIIVGENVPFITGQYTTPGTVGISPFQTVDRQDIGLTLRVKPQISQGGTVKLAIYQETSAIIDATNPAGLITSKRSLDTNVLVDDGQVIVLGGLIDDNVQDSVEKVPVLGDIPFIGNLFKYKTRSRIKTNLMVFLRPTIIRNDDQSVDLAGDRYDFIRNEEAKGLPEQSNFLPNLDKPQLPPLENGSINADKMFDRSNSGSLFKRIVPPEKLLAMPPSSPVVQPPAAVTPQQ